MNLAIPEEEPRKVKDEESPDRKSAGKRKAEYDLETALSLYAGANREDKESTLLLERLGHYPPLEKRPRLDSIPFLAIPSPFQAASPWTGGTQFEEKEPGYAEPQEESYNGGGYTGDFQGNYCPPRIPQEGPVQQPLPPHFRSLVSQLPPDFKGISPHAVGGRERSMNSFDFMEL